MDSTANDQDDNQSHDAGDFEPPEIDPDLVIRGGVPIDDDTYYGSKPWLGHGVRATKSSD
jgi:hypothetical protein